MAKMCSQCNGNGICTNCYGSGNGKSQNPHPSSPLVNPDTGRVKCLACNGSGKCVECRGTGRE
jgi:hypothetical protein